MGKVILQKKLILMKLTFTFTDSPDLVALTRDDIFNTHFEIPDEALHLIGVRERVIKIGELIGELTEACLHISCKEIGLDHFPIKTSPIRVGRSVMSEDWVLFIVFERF